MAYTAKDILAQPVRLLEQAAEQGSEAIAFANVNDAKTFYRRIRALNVGKGAKLGCVIGRNGSIVWAASDEAALPEVRLVGVPSANSKED